MIEHFFLYRNLSQQKWVTLKLYNFQVYTGLNRDHKAFPFKNCWRRQVRGFSDIPAILKRSPNNLTFLHHIDVWHQDET